MKVFAELPFDNFCMMRIVKALKLYAPNNIEFVNTEKDADLVILYVHGHRDRVWWKMRKHQEAGRECLVIQLQLKNSVNPKTEDWLGIWENARLVWSHWDIPSLCKDEGNRVNFNFYHAPLGVDSEVFKETKLDRKYIIGIHSIGWSRESLRDVITASREVGKIVLNFESPKNYGEGVEYAGAKIDDFQMAHFYSQCKYVSGLRRVEGFELPVIEGLMCGARPIVFDLPCYRHWFNGLAEFIPEEGGSTRIIPALVEVFKKEPVPVSDDEKQFVKDKFNWEKIVRGFWMRI